MNTSAKLWWERQDSCNSCEDSCCREHTFQQQHEHPGFVLEPDIEHIWDPSHTDTVQEKPPKEVNSILNVPVPSPSIVEEEKPYLRRKLAGPREKPSAGTLLPKTTSTIPLDTPICKDGRKESAGTVCQDNICIVLQEIVSSNAKIQSGVSIFTKRQPSWQTPVLAIHFNHQIQFVNGTNSMAKRQGGTSSSGSKGM